MSEKTLKILNGISQALGESYDGAVDEDGNPIKIGLKREEGNPLLDKRRMDGFNGKVSGNVLILNYHSEISLKDVYVGKLENEIEETLADIVKHLKKRYRKITGDSLSLKEKGEVDARVEKINNHRVHVMAKKLYDISGMDNVETVGQSNKDSLEKSFKKFLELGDSPSKAKNDTRRKEA